MPFTEKGLEFYLECAKKYKKVFKLWFGPLQAAIVTVHPESMKAIMSLSGPKGMFAYNMIVPWIGECFPRIRI